MIRRICYVDEDGRFGGPQQRMLLVASKLKAKNVEVDFVIPKDETKIFKKKLLSKGLKFHELNITRLSLKISFLLKYFLFFFYEIIILMIFFKKNKYQLIQANSTPQFKAVIAGFLIGLKVVWVIEDSYFPKIIVLIFRALAKITNCKIVYTSQRVYDFYFKDRKILKNDLSEIFAPVDLILFNPEQKFLVPPYIDENKFTITTVASLVPVKGLEYFIEAADKIYKKKKALNFIIAGPEISSQKRYSKKIKLMLKNKPYIKFIGMCENIPELLANSDLFICSSISEAGPMTVYEAMAMKVPVITTDVGASIQIIKNFESGIIVPPKNSLEIYSALVKLTNNKALQDNIALKGYQTANKFFSLDKITEQYIEFYNN